VRIYAERPGTRTRQLLTDVLVIIWVYAWSRIGLWLHDQVQRLAAPGRRMESAGSGLADNLASAGDKLDGVPGVGDSLAAPFDKAADAARSLAAAGREPQDLVGDLALVLSLALVAVPLGLVLFVWLPLRVRWIRRASTAAALRRAVSGRDLLALRALATQPLRKLTRLDPEIAALWRRGNPEAVEALAALELRSLGLRPSRG
jgi:hypothetical protein